jgi:hypothetical protein
MCIGLSHDEGIVTKPDVGGGEKIRQSTLKNDGRKDQVNSRKIQPSGKGETPDSIALTKSPIEACRSNNPSIPKSGESGNLIRLIRAASVLICEMRHSEVSTGS